MIPAYKTAALCAAIYQAVDVRMPAIWHNYWTANSVHIAHRREGDIDILVLRGSQSIEDWLRDFRGWPAKHPLLGYCHAGFLEDMDSVVDEVRHVLRGRVVITGHSLGAARALILGGLLASQGVPVEQITVHGSPRPGFGKLRDILLDSGARIDAYKNRDDPVTRVPYLLGMYVHPVEPQKIDAAPAADDIARLREHHIALYEQGERQLLNQQVANAGSLAPDG